jgi:hypothetical protein
VYQDKGCSQTLPERVELERVERRADSKTLKRRPVTALHSKKTGRPCVPSRGRPESWSVSIRAWRPTLRWAQDPGKDSWNHRWFLRKSLGDSRTEAGFK